MGFDCYLYSTGRFSTPLPTCGVYKYISIAIFHCKCRICDIDDDNKNDDNNDDDDDDNNAKRLGSEERPVFL